MSTRTIEITAKTEQEARDIANGELNENEVISATEVLSAPARGLFGFVGKQEFKIRFVIGEKPQAPPRHEPVVTPVTRDDAVDGDEEMPVRPPRRESSDDARPPRRERSDSGRPPRRGGNRSQNVDGRRGRGAPDTAMKRAKTR